MCSPIPDLPPGEALGRTWTTRATHFTSLDICPASSCGIRSDTSTGVPTFSGTVVEKKMPRCDMFSDSAACSVDPGLLSTRNRKGTRMFTRVSIRRSLELMVSSPLAGLSARGYQSRKGGEIDSSAPRTGSKGNAHLLRDMDHAGTSCAIMRL